MFGCSPWEAWSFLGTDVVLDQGTKGGREGTKRNGERKSCDQDGLYKRRINKNKRKKQIKLIKMKN